MADTINKIRINGVTKDIAGSGGGGISGAYLAPINIISPEKLGFEYVGSAQFVLDFSEMARQFIAAGINLDDTVKYQGQRVYIYISACGMSNYYNPGFLKIDMAQNGNSTSVSVSSIYYHGSGIAEQVLLTSTAASTLTYRNLFDTLINGSDYQSAGQLAFAYPGSLSNQIIVDHSDINEYEYYNIPDIEVFFENVMVEYHSGS